MEKLQGLLVMKINKSILNSISSFLSESSLFNGTEYLNYNSDVRDSKIDPVKHYVFHGQNEKRIIQQGVENVPSYYELPGTEVVISKAILDIFKNVKSQDIRNYIHDKKPSLIDRIFSIGQKNNLAISVVICTYNGKDTVLSALESVVNQTYQNIEVVIVDDASTDCTVDLIERFIDTHQQSHRFKLIEKKINRGLTDSISIALQNCKGRYVCFLEQDDIFDKDNLLEKVKTISRYPSAVLITGFTIPFGDIEEKLKTQDYIAGNRIRLNSTVNQISTRELLKQNPIPSFSGTLVQRKILKRINFQNTDHQKLDWFLWACILKNNPLHLCPESVVYWRKHGSSLSNNLHKHLSTRDVFLKNIHRHLNVQYQSNDQNVETILESGLFDVYWYSKTYQIDIDYAVSHYLHLGWLEGNDPSPWFSNNDYLLFHEDVRRANINPLLHYCLHGSKKPKRVYSQALQSNQVTKIVWLTSAATGGAVFEYRLRNVAARIGIELKHIHFGAIHELDPDILNHINSAKILIMNRPLVTGQSASLIRFARTKGLTLFADFDDLISPNKFYCNGRYLSLGGKDSVIADAEKQVSVLPLFDCLTVSTDYLYDFYSKNFNSNCFKLRNKIFTEDICKENQTILPVRQGLKIAIFSGSLTHDFDIETVLFELIAISFMFDIKLYIFGKSNIPGKYRKFISIEFLPYKDSIIAMTEMDLIVVPLAFNEFNRAKSNIRFLEAAKAKRPILAPNIGEFSSIITDGQDGFLYEEGDFYKRFLSLVMPFIINSKIDHYGFCNYLDEIGTNAFFTLNKYHTVNILSDDDLAFKNIVQSLLLKENLDADA